MVDCRRLTPSRRIRYPDPAIKVNDTVKIDLSTGKISEYIHFDTGVIAMVTGGRNMGRVGVITHRERHDGGFNIVHIKDAIDNSFATREHVAQWLAVAAARSERHPSRLKIRSSP